MNSGPVRSSHSMLDHVDQRAVAGRFGDAQVEHPVARQRLAPASISRSISSSASSIAATCACFADFAASAAHSASITYRARNSSNGPAAASCPLLAVIASGRAHVDPRADAHVDQPFDFQRDQRLAHRRPRHAQLPRQVPLRRQARRLRRIRRADQRADLVGDLAIQPAGFDALERHGLHERRACTLLSRHESAEATRTGSSGQVV